MDESDVSLWITEMYIYVWWKKPEDRMSDWLWEEARRDSIFTNRSRGKQQSLPEGEVRISKRINNRGLGLCRVHWRHCLVHFGGDTKQYEQIRTPKKWMKTEEGSIRLRKMHLFGFWVWSHAGLGAHCCPWLASGGWWELGSSCSAQGQGTPMEDVPPWITAVFHSTSLFALSHT